MDYKQRYEEALERAKDMLSYKEVRREDMEYLFPELRASEDERIRKWLLDFVRGLPDEGLDFHFYNLTKEEVLTWLEKQGEITIWDKKDEQILNAAISHIKNKTYNYCGGYTSEYVIQWLESLKDRYICTSSEKQGKQKPTDKVEPKFKTGQWIVWKDKCYKVNYNGCGYELVSQSGLSISLEYGTIDKNAHLWTIQDAKDGDVLVTESGRPFIFKGYLDKLHPNCPVAYGGIDSNDDFYVGFSMNRWTGGKVYPATIEQHELLFRKMKEEGYKWDADKKELIKL